MRASRLRTCSVVAVTATLIVGCSSTVDEPKPRTSPPSTAGQNGVSSGPSAQPGAGRAQVLVTGLAVPWGIAFLPGGGALVSERDTHRIIAITDDGATTTVGTVPGVKDDAGEGGLLGLALSPGFAKDRLVYAYLTSVDDNRVVRFRYTATGLGPVSTVFTGIPAAGIHNGGRIAFGPDKLLYVTTGDAGQAERAPDPDYLGGKVLRMTRDGQPTPGNPDADSVVWTRGHRNPQGLAFGPDGTIYEAEFGQNSLDEINKLEGGNDYGWPSVEGTEGDAKGKTAPLRTFATSEASPSGLAYASGALWLGALRGQRLFRIPVRSDGSLGDPQILLKDAYGRLRTAARAPDGALWVTTSNRDGRGSPKNNDDRIIRIPLS